MAPHADAVGVHTCVGLDRGERVQHVNRVARRAIGSGGFSFGKGMAAIVRAEYDVAVARKRILVGNIALGGAVDGWGDVAVVEDDRRPTRCRLPALRHRHVGVDLQPFGEIGNQVAVVVAAGRKRLLHGDGAARRLLLRQPGERKCDGVDGRARDGCGAGRGRGRRAGTHSRRCGRVDGSARGRTCACRQAEFPANNQLVGVGNGWKRSVAGGRGIGGSDNARVGGHVAQGACGYRGERVARLHVHCGGAWRSRECARLRQGGARNQRAAKQECHQQEGGRRFFESDVHA